MGSVAPTSPGSRPPHLPAHLVPLPQLQAPSSSRVNSRLSWATSPALFSHPVLSDSATPWAAARRAFLSLTISQHLPKVTPVASAMPSSHLVL